MAYRTTERVRAHKAEVRRSIVSAARRAVAEAGFRAPTVADVARRAEVATGTVYRYFPSKTELFAEVFRLSSGWEVERMAEAARGPEPPPMRLARAIEIFARRAIAGRRLAYALIAEPAMPEIEAERLVYRRAYARVLARLIAEGAADGSFDVPDVELSAAALVGALVEPLIGPLAPENTTLERDADRIIAALVRLCLAALGARTAGGTPS